MDKQKAADVPAIQDPSEALAEAELRKRMMSKYTGGLR